MHFISFQTTADFDMLGLGESVNYHYRLHWWLFVPYRRAKKVIFKARELHCPPSGRFAGFVNNFLRVPLACLGSREAA